MRLVEGSVGNKGENLRQEILEDALGLKPGDRVIFIVQGDYAIMKKKPTPLDLLRSKRAKVSLEELAELRKEFEREIIHG